MLGDSLLFQLRLRQVLRFGNGQLTALQLRFLLQLLGAKPQLLLTDLQLLEASRLLFPKLQPELLALLSNALLFEVVLRLVLRHLRRELLSELGRLVLHPLSFQSQLLLRNTQLLQADLLVLGQLQAKLPRLFA